MAETLDHLGNVYKSRAAMCKAYGISDAMYMTRLHAGATVEQALDMNFCKFHNTGVILDKVDKTLPLPLDNTYHFRLVDSYFKLCLLLYNNSIDEIHKIEEVNGNLIIPIHSIFSRVCKQVNYDKSSYTYITAVDNVKAKLITALYSLGWGYANSKFSYRFCELLLPSRLNENNFSIFLPSSISKDNLLIVGVPLNICGINHLHIENRSRLAIHKLDGVYHISFKYYIVEESYTPRCGYLGVDVGLGNLATLSNGVVISHNTSIKAAIAETISSYPACIVLEDLDLDELRNLHPSNLWNNVDAYITGLVEQCSISHIPIIYANRYYPSSKNCCICGNHKNNLDLLDRTYICDKCGITIDRDLNAAINLSRYVQK